MTAPPVHAAETGTIVGTIRYGGKAPLPLKIVPSTDVAVCGQQGLLDEKLLVAKDGGLANVVVWVVSSTRAEAKSEPVTIDNLRCRYEPHVVVAHVDEPLMVRNRDRFLHTSQAKESSGKPVFSVALPTQNMTIEKRFKRRGVYSVDCDVHPWMRGWVVVLAGELAATTSPTGAFRIAGVSAGKHTLKLWHEVLGDRTLDVEVKPGADSRGDARWPAP